MRKTEVILTNINANVNALVNGSLKKKVSISRKPSGAPVVEGADAYISLSHKDKYLCVAVSSKEVGVDIEKIVDKPSIYKIAKRYFAEPVNDCREFYLAWTRKEAFGKLLGSGLDKDVLGKDLSQDTYDLPEGTVRFSTFDYQDYMITVACFDEEPCFKEALKKRVTPSDKKNIKEE